MPEKRRYILVIEDNKVLGDLILKTLEDQGFEAVLIENGREGMDSLKAREPDMLLLDIVLPEMSGYEILEQMSKSGMMERVRTIIISNSGEPVQISRAMTLGVKDYIVKADLSVEEVLERVQKQFASTGEAAPAGDVPPPGERLKVLLVEDDTFLQDIAGRVIGKVFDIHYATDADSVFKETASWTPDAIMLDIVLPGGKSGLDILEVLRKDPKLEKTAILMFSNLSQDSDKDRAMKNGADTYIVKAEFDIEGLETMIREQVKKRREKLA